MKTADAADVALGITRIKKGAIIPVDVRDRLYTESVIVGVAIDLVVGNGMLHEIRAHLLLAPRGVNDDFPTLGMKSMQRLDNILSRKSENTAALPAIIISNNSVKIDGNGTGQSLALPLGRWFARGGPA